MMDKRVLLIEDDDLLRELYEIKLCAEGFDVEATTNGKDALDKVHDYRPKIILLDMMMPVMTGMEFLQQFQPMRHPKIKVLVLSNKAAPNEMYEAKKLGAADYLLKSQYTPDDLVQEVCKHLDDAIAS
jgi:DNA-binding response OmpR family regulator